ncbi:MAG TPA: DNA-binding response regulator [Acidimicrobiaceae bacterium]|nr:DNA-binding response regulator [Acidimicrobiaceae bacterium]
MTDGADVLVVEDAPEYATVASTVLVAAGHSVHTATTVAQAMSQLHRVRPQVVVLDLSLPDGDGLDLCRHICEHSDAFVLMVTGRDTPDDRVRGFGAGADDYLIKPYSPRELGVRVDALLRRPRGGLPALALRRCGDLLIDPRTREVHIGDDRIEVTRIEFGLLEALSARPHAVLSRRELLDRVWGDQWVADDHVVDVHIANLRRKIDRGRDPSRSRVRTVRGVGYALSD